MTIHFKVRYGSYPGMIAVESGGKIEGRNLLLDTDILKVDKDGEVSATGLGWTGGQGQGVNNAGGSYGGTGGANPDIAGMFSFSLCFKCRLYVFHSFTE